MKKLMVLMLGLGLVFGTIANAFGQDTKKGQSTKKAKKKKKQDTTKQA